MVSKRWAASQPPGESASKMAREAREAVPVRSSICVSDAGTTPTEQRRPSDSESGHELSEVDPGTDLPAVDFAYGYPEGRVPVLDGHKDRPALWQLAERDQRGDVTRAVVPGYADD